jgi:hypothetical protein
MIVLIDLLISYLIGIFLGHLNTVLERNFWRPIKYFWRDRDKLDLATTENTLSYVYDFIQYHEPSIGARLAKLSAERTLCRVLMMGLAILLITYMILVRCESFDIKRPIIEIGLALMIISAFCFNQRLKDRSEKLMINSWRLIHEANKKS